MRTRKSSRRQNAGVQHFGQKSNYELLDDEQKELFNRMDQKSKDMWLAASPEEAVKIRPRKAIDFEFRMPPPANEAERFIREYDARREEVASRPRVPDQPRFFGFIFSLLGDKDPRINENEEYKKVKAANPAYKDPFELNGVGIQDRNPNNPPAWFKRDAPVKNEYDMDIDEGGRRMRRRKTLRRGSVRRMKRRV
jgi:hypothetical protein